MRGLPAVLAAAALLWTAACPTAPAQEVPVSSGEEASAPSPGMEAAPGALPGAFVPEDRSPFLTGLRRFEIVAFGSFPIMLFYANLGFDISRYARSGYDPFYAPWPLKNEYSYKPSTREILASIGTAALLSVGVGTLDAVIRASRDRKAGGRARVDSP
mgnify:FL=1